MSKPETMNVLLEMISFHAQHSGEWDNATASAEAIKGQFRLAAQDSDELDQFDIEVIQVHDEICVQLVEKSAVDQLAKLAEERDEH